MILSSKNTITSLELVEQINVFRADIEGKSMLKHMNLLATIRDEFEEEISVTEISVTEYLYKGKKYPMFNLTLAQAKQVLIRESKVVRKAVIKYIEELEKGLLPSYQIEDNILRAKKWILEAKETKALQEQVQEQAPKVEYYEEVLSSKDTYTPTQLAKELGMRSAIALNKELQNKGVQFKQSGQWMLYSKYAGTGYTDTKTSTFVHSDGSTGSTTSTRWTEKGREFILELFKDSLQQNLLKA